MTTTEIKVPNIGDAKDVDVIEILVAPGDKIKKEDPLITLESDKASMEIPSPLEGIVENISVKIGDKVSEGSSILMLKTADEATQAPAETKKEEKKEEKKAEPKEEKKEEKTEPKKERIIKVAVPDIGDAKDVDVIEILVKPGTKVNKEDSLITLESEKASMEIPSPASGVVQEIKLKVGDKVSQGDEILTLVSSDEKIPATKEEKPAAQEEKKEAQKAVPVSETRVPQKAEEKIQPEFISSEMVHAGPAVRRLAREFGIDLRLVKPTGPKERVLKEDLQNFVKSALKQTGAPGIQIGKIPEVDFAKFGEIEKVPLSKIKKLTGQHVLRSWLSIPHVTQFGEADITDLEEFRKTEKEVVEKQGIKLTPLVFIMKAVVASLQEFPFFNASLDTSGENLVLKKYFNIGIAVDTPNGLVVPVIKDVDKKNMVDLATELSVISKKAREKGLTPAEMSGSCFTISSLGGIGGTAFTPIVNAPDVAILGVSKASIKPIYQQKEFVPRLMLPLSLSYDHRVIDGADGARFIVHLANTLSDIRTLLL